MLRDWLRDWRTWVGGGIALALVGLAARRVLAPSPVTIDASGLAQGYGRAYRVTAEDRLWLARALLGEVNETPSAWSGASTRQGGAAVLWALVQGYLSRGYRNHGSLTAFARAYCQPINPRWARGGDLAAANGSTEDQLVRRARITATPWSAVPAALQQLVTSWAAGGVSNPIPGLTDWSGYPWDGAQVQVAGNWFGARYA